jgi:hypothetical protein
MLAALSTVAWDPAGHIVIHALPDSSIGETRRRVNRIATLDGGVVLNDRGFSEGDRTVELKWRPASATDEAVIDRLVRTYTRLILSIRAGCYLVAPETYTPGAEESTLRLLVVSKLSA